MVIIFINTTCIWWSRPIIFNYWMMWKIKKF